VSHDETRRAGFLRTLSRLRAEIAVGFVLVLAAAGFTLAQLDVALPFRWCPAGTVDRIECFRGWLVTSAGWIAALVAFVMIRRIRKQVESLEEEVERNVARERSDALHALREELFGFATLEHQLFHELRLILDRHAATGSVPAEDSRRLGFVLAELERYDWSRLKDRDLPPALAGEFEMFRLTVRQLAAMPVDDPAFAAAARHYVAWRAGFFGKIEQETGIGLLAA
jgi:hypothetical protein